MDTQSDTKSSISPKHPEVKVKLVDEDGNAFFVLGKCSKAAQCAGVSKEERGAFMKEAMSGDYDHLLQTCIKWFNVS